MTTITVVIPARNEASALIDVLPRLNRVQRITEVIVVDDGSEDDTRAVAQAQGARVVRHAVSMGNGAAVKAGARAATSDYILFMDGDGQHRPEDIPALLECVEGEGWDMVVGSRGAEDQASLPRRVANAFYNKFASAVTGQKIDDLTSGFRVVRRDLFLRYISLLPNGFSYPTTITMTLLRAGYQVRFLPVRVENRAGKSNIRPLRDGFRFLLIIFKVGTLYSPLKVFVPLAVVSFLLGIVRYIYTYLQWGTFTNMSALLFVTAVQIFLVGLVSEQITALIYKESENHKH